MDINAERQRRAELAAEARALQTAAEEASRDLTPEEEQKFDRLMDDADKIDVKVKREEKLREHEREDAARDADRDRGRRGDQDLTPEQRAFRAYLVGGRAALSEAQLRAMSASSDPEGGFLVAPQQVAKDLIKAVDDAVFVRQRATVIPLTTAESLGVPTLDQDLNDAEWTSELQTGSLDESIRIGKRELRPHPLAKRTKISRKLLRQTATNQGLMNPETLVRDRLAYKFGITAEKAYLVGDGNQKPLGVFTNSPNGITTARDKVVYDQSDNKFLADGLIDAKYFLKAAYWGDARWLFHRDAVRQLRKLRDDTGGAGLGNFLWSPGLAGGVPDTILDVPYDVSEYCPNTFTNGLYIGLLASWKFYHIVDALQLEVQRLVELYAETNQVGFIGRLESDGMPVLEEPFVRLSVQS